MPYSSTHMATVGVKEFFTLTFFFWYTVLVRCARARARSSRLRSSCSCGETVDASIQQSPQHSQVKVNSKFTYPHFMQHCNRTGYTNIWQTMLSLTISWSHWKCAIGRGDHLAVHSTSSGPQQRRPNSWMCFDGSAAQSSEVDWQNRCYVSPGVTAVSVDAEAVLDWSCSVVDCFFGL